jgi:hypothetical protein
MASRNRALATDKQKFGNNVLAVSPSRYQSNS